MCDIKSIFQLLIDLHLSMSILFQQQYMGLSRRQFYRRVVKTRKAREARDALERDPHPVNSELFVADLALPEDQLPEPEDVPRLLVNWAMILIHWMTWIRSPKNRLISSVA